MSLVLHMSHDRREPFLKDPEGPIGCYEKVNKPKQAFWTSPLELAPIFSEWVEHCLESEFHFGHYGYIYDDSSVNYLELDSTKSLSSLEPYLDGETKQMFAYHANYDRIANEYDGILVDRDIITSKTPWNGSTMDKPFFSWEVTSKAIFKPEKLKLVDSFEFDRNKEETAAKIEKLLTA